MSLSEEEKLLRARARSKAHYHNNKQYYLDWQRHNVASRLVSVAKQRAKNRGIPFEITKDDIVVPDCCPVFGMKLEMNQGRGAGGKDNSYSLDRIDTSKGYIKGNVMVISNKANSMKFTASKEELLQFATWIGKTYV